MASNRPGPAGCKKASPRAARVFSTRSSAIEPPEAISGTRRPLPDSPRTAPRAPPPPRTLGGARASGPPAPHPAPADFASGPAPDRLHEPPRRFLGGSIGKNARGGVPLVLSHKDEDDFFGMEEGIP